MSAWLTGAYPGIQEEKQAIVEAGPASSPWQHMDDTGTRVNRENHHCQILCNSLYGAYFTTARKDRLKRVAGYGPRSLAGARTWDAMETLLSAARKLGVNFFQYIRDRVSGVGQMLSLVDLIKQRAETMVLGSSWTPTRPPVNEKIPLKETSICIVDQHGARLREGAVPTNPESIAAFSSGLRSEIQPYRDGSR